MGSLAFLSVEERPLALDIQSLANSMVRLDISDSRRVLSFMGVQSSLLDRIRGCQFEDDTLVKAEHLRPGGEFQRLPIPEWKWERITTDFVVGLPRTSRGVDNIWVIVDHRGSQFTSSFRRAFQEELGTRVHLSTSFHPQTDGQSEGTIQVLEDMLRACVMDFGEPRPRGTDLLQEALDQVKVMQDRLRTAQSYVDQKRRPLRFSVDDRTVGEVAYELALPPAFSAIHRVFHVSMLRWYVPDESHILQYGAVELDDRLTFVEEPVAILARDVRRLRSRAIPVVKVHWRHRPVEEATWKTEHEMREQFPSLFEPSAGQRFEDVRKGKAPEKLFWSSCDWPTELVKALQALEQRRLMRKEGSFEGSFQANSENNESNKGRKENKK
ncbi:uncharacterized protein [Solanum tuberosum]|uniref:uncharacterized protein n=1 Tax=Solanum tuberosum TaxID=4113 RepID=UPI00073A121C|nr:PREDICTED: uncharacterized protein LOC107061213 [Solanum tuberosum]